MNACTVWLPGPWWHGLTYLCDEPAPVGRRVRVPVGRGSRLGLCVGEAPVGGRHTLRSVTHVLDEKPVLPASLIEALNWTARSFFCGPGDLVRQLLPGAFWSGEPLPQWEESSGPGARSETFYDGCDSVRFDFVAQQLSATDGGALCLTSEVETARRWHARLKTLGWGDRLLLWPKGARAIYRAWCTCLTREDVLIIGGPAAVLAPLRRPRLCVVEGEAEGPYQLRSGVGISIRSLAARRFAASGATTLLTGRMPSTRVFTSQKPIDHQTKRGRLRFVSLFDAQQHELSGFRFPFTLAESVLNDTRLRLSEQRTVLWLLDRRGEAGEVRCQECGSSLNCPVCEKTMVLRGGELLCPVCGHREPLPSLCPACGGRLLQSRRPGLEALVPLARALAGETPVYLWHQTSPSTISEARARLSVLRERGGLVLGSRRALSLLSELSVPLVCWLDADSEARQADYEARLSAFSMVLESLERGNDPTRDVILQTRTPKNGWQADLLIGWSSFLRREMAERRELGFPPYAYLLEIVPNGLTSDLTAALAEGGFPYMESPESLAVLTDRLAPLHHCLASLFSIARSRQGYPKIRLRLD